MLSRIQTAQTASRRGFTFYGNFFQLNPMNDKDQVFIWNELKQMESLEHWIEI